MSEEEYGKFTKRLVKEIREGMQQTMAESKETKTPKESGCGGEMSFTEEICERVIFALLNDMKHVNWEDRLWIAKELRFWIELHYSVISEKDNDCNHYTYGSLTDYTWEEEE